LDKKWEYGNVTDKKLQMQATKLIEKSVN